MLKCFWYRARIILLKSDGVSINEIADKVGLNRKSTDHQHCVSEDRDSDFNSKIHNVILVYKQLSFQFDEANEEPVIFHWKYNLDDVDVSEEIIVDTLPIKMSS